MIITAGIFYIVTQLEEGSVETLLRTIGSVITLEQVQILFLVLYLLRFS